MYDVMSERAEDFIDNNEIWCGHIGAGNDPECHAYLLAGIGSRRKTASDHEQHPRTVRAPLPGVLSMMWVAAAEFWVWRRFYSVHKG